MYSVITLIELSVITLHISGLALPAIPTPSKSSRHGRAEGDQTPAGDTGCSSANARQQAGRGPARSRSAAHFRDLRHVVQPAPRDADLSVQVAPHGRVDRELHRDVRRVGAAGREHPYMRARTSTIRELQRIGLEMTSLFQ